MTLWSLVEVAPHLNAVLHGNGAIRPNALSIDTRTLQPGNCFVALRAERDGHEFAAKAVEKGAAALLVDHVMDLPVPQLVVQDTLNALQSWGKARLQKVAPRTVMGVTGSVGKTSTKELLSAATGAWKTPGNRNNTLGMPEALATLPTDTQTVVLEMGMSTPGEIARLVEIAPLDFGLITHVGTAHIAFFPDGQAGIARAKGEMLPGIRSGGAWTHLADDPWCTWIASQPWAQHARAVPVGEGAAYGWEAVESLGPLGERFRLRTPKGTLPLALQLRGLHQVKNAALAAALALEAGFDPSQVTQGLHSVQPETGRGRLHRLQGDGWLLDESYNASPDSVIACAKALLTLQGGEPVALLGCMRELGPEAPRIHQDMGAALRAIGIQKVWVYGDFAKDLARGFGAAAKAYPTLEGLRDDPGGLGAVPKGARILVKGSFYWGCDRVVKWLRLQFEPGFAE